MAAWFDRLRGRPQPRRDAGVLDSDAFSPGARVLLAAAQRLAEAQGHGSLRSEHLLLAMLADAASPGRQALRRQGVDLAALAAELARHLRTPSGPPGDRGQVLSLDLVVALSRAQQIAVTRAAQRVGEAELLLAIVATPDSGGAAALRVCGVLPEALWTALPPQDAGDSEAD